MTLFNAVLGVGCGERFGAGHPQHFQRAPHLYHLLAHLRHHGRSTLCRKILQGKEKCDILILMLLNHTHKPGLL